MLCSDGANHGLKRGIVSRACLQGKNPKAMDFALGENKKMEAEPFQWCPGDGHQLKHEKSYLDIRK